MKSPYAKAKKILRVADQVVEKLRKDAQLDEYQRAQVVQSLVMGKMKLEQELEWQKESEAKYADERGEVEDGVVRLEREIGELVKDMDFEKLSGLLGRLSIGVEQIIKDKKNGGK